MLVLSYVAAKNILIKNMLEIKGNGPAFKTFFFIKLYLIIAFH